jgi:hypothetical protein
MKVYDQLAFSAMPLFYITSPSSSDVSLASHYSLTTNFAGTNQPIIAGSQSSFHLNSSSTFSLTSSDQYIQGLALEFVANLKSPVNDIPFLVNSNGSGIFLYPNGIYVKVYCNDGRPTMVYAPIEDWNNKLYINVELHENNIILKINSRSYTAIYSSTPLPVFNNFSLAALPSDYIASIDGIGIYNTTMIDKLFCIDDRGQGYEIYSASGFSGKTTLFNTIETEFDTVISSSDFVTQNNTLSDYFIYNGQQGSYFILRHNSKFPLYYNTNNSTWQILTNPTIVVNSGVKTIGFSSNFITDFDVSITSIIDGSISWHSPAILQLTGQMVPPLVIDECIANCPDGADLSGASYTGNWLISDSLDVVPKTVEIVFMPLDTNLTYVYSSSDGSASYGSGGSITGYTAYLNGVLVTDLTTILLDQWNHLVLTKSSTSGTTIYLNTNASAATPGEIKYMLLTAYPNVLVLGQVQLLNSVLLGLGSISVSEQTITISEGTFISGEAFNVYSYPWAILGAGGH